ncbi:MAG TPA: hypothetical protein VMW03_09775 [Candidatus Krumholzibacteriaceae bacterium]|nr:hypothetical protein [Candidatus Krumholzibacteriaceae bacterium]
MNEYSGYGAKRVRRFGRSSDFIINTMNIKGEGKIFVEPFTDTLG